MAIWCLKKEKALKKKDKKCEEILKKKENGGGLFHFERNAKMKSIEKPAEKIKGV